MFNGFSHPVTLENSTQDSQNCPEGCLHSRLRKGKEQRLLFGDICGPSLEIVHIASVFIPLARRLPQDPALLQGKLANVVKLLLEGERKKQHRQCHNQLIN